MQQSNLYSWRSTCGHESIYYKKYNILWEAMHVFLLLNAKMHGYTLVVTILWTELLDWYIFGFYTF